MRFNLQSPPTAQSILVGFVLLAGIVFHGFVFDLGLIHSRNSCVTTSNELLLTCSECRSHCDGQAPGVNPICLKCRLGAGSRENQMSQPRKQQRTGLTINPPQGPSHGSWATVSVRSTANRFYHRSVKVSHAASAAVAGSQNWTSLEPSNSAERRPDAGSKSTMRRSRQH